MFKVICGICLIIGVVNSVPYPGHESEPLQTSTKRIHPQFGVHGPPTAGSLPPPGFHEPHDGTPSAGHNEDLRNPAAIESKKAVTGEIDGKEGDKESLEGAEFGWGWGGRRVYYYYPRYYYAPRYDYYWW